MNTADAERRLHSTVIAIDFKRFLIKYDRDSRNQLLTDCEILLSHLNTEENTVESARSWVQEIRSTNSHTDDTQFKNHRSWILLSQTIHFCFTFEKVIKSIFSSSYFSDNLQ